MSKQSVRTGRRGFPKGLAVAGSGAAVAGLATTAQAAGQTEPQPDEEQPKQTGYRETAHVRSYYEKARF